MKRGTSMHVGLPQHRPGCVGNGAGWRMLSLVRYRHWGCRGQVLTRERARESVAVSFLFGRKEEGGMAAYGFSCRALGSQHALDKRERGDWLA